MIQWLIIILWVVGAIASIALLRRRRDWSWPVPRFRIRGFRCELGTPHVVEDNIVRQVWAVPIIFTNGHHRPARLASIDQIASIRSNQRTRLLHRAFRYHGTFSWNEAAAASRGEVNPRATVTATVHVELPVDEAPEALTFTTRRRRGRPVRYGSRVPQTETIHALDAVDA